MKVITATHLGNKDFKRDYGLQYAYLAGAMYKGIASPALVVAMSKAGFMGYLGTRGLKYGRIEEAIQQIQQQLLGPALGSFNQWVKDSSWKNWCERCVAVIANGRNCRCFQ